MAGRRRWFGLWTVVALLLSTLGAAVLVLGNFLQYKHHLKLYYLFLDNYSNLSSVFLGAVVTVALVDSISRRIERRSAASETTMALLSVDSHVREAALQRARAQNWLVDGTMSGMALGGVSLAAIDLEAAVLRRVDFVGATLSGSKFYKADLREATFIDAVCHDCDFTLANLRRARLYRAQLEGSHLGGADLRGASLANARLEGANVAGCRMNRMTVLPDGSHWSPDRDLAEFVNPRSA